MAKMVVEEHQACRRYVLEMDDADAKRHADIMVDFIDRFPGLAQPPRGTIGPAYDENIQIIPGRKLLVFYLNEWVCEEYERRMGFEKQCKAKRKEQATRYLKAVNQKQPSAT